jgi:hypothetical protein
MHKRNHILLQSREVKIKNKFLSVQGFNSASLSKRKVENYISYFE